MKLQPVLVEKDYWIMHCLYGLQHLKMTFELKGGTSLSKGDRIINRFSEDRYPYRTAEDHGCENRPQSRPPKGSAPLYRDKATGAALMEFDRGDGPMASASTASLSIPPRNDGLAE